MSGFYAIGEQEQQSFGSSGNLAAALNSAVTFTNTGGFSSIGFYVAVPPGATVVFEGRYETTTGIWSGARMRSNVTDNYVSGATISGTFNGSISMFREFRVRVSVAGSGSAGTVVGTAGIVMTTLEGQEHGPPDLMGFEAVIGPMRQIQTAEPFRACGNLFAATLDTSYWTASNTGAGSAAGVSNGVATVTSGTANSGIGALVTAQVARFVFAHPHMTRGMFRVTAVAAANTTRRWGAFTVSGSTPQNGAYFECDADGTLTAKTSSGGSVSYSAAISFTLDTNVHSYEIVYFVGGAWFMIDNALVATIQPTTAILMQTFSLPVQFHAVNSASGTTSASLECWGSVTLRMGRQITRTIYRNISGASTNTLKQTSGVLKSVILNSTGGTSVTVYDNTAASGAKIATISTGAIQVLTYDAQFDIGLTIVTVGAACDITVVWE